MHLSELKLQGHRRFCLIVVVDSDPDMKYKPVFQEYFCNLKADRLHYQHSTQTFCHDLSFYMDENCFISIRATSPRLGGHCNLSSIRHIARVVKQAL